MPATAQWAASHQLSILMGDSFWSALQGNTKLPGGNDTRRKTLFAFCQLLRLNTTMGDENHGDVTQLLAAAAAGDRAAVGRIYAILYPELKAMAHRRVRHEAFGSTLDTTALVHESYLRLAKADSLNLENRRHFLAYASHVMRSVVVDLVRQARAQRRGGDQLLVTLNTNRANSVESSTSEIVRLDELLSELAEIDPRLVSVVEMRYFAALEVPQIAEYLDVSARTIQRDLEKVRLLLIDARS
jgi:RNA polymerase sigma factor (TIGR02999 family)